MTNDSESCIMDMDIEDCERDSVEEEGFRFDHSEVFFMCINLALPHTPLQILYTFHKVPHIHNYFALYIHSKDFAQLVHHVCTYFCWIPHGCCI